MSDRLEIRMSPELLERLDAARGEVPRGTFIKRALESALGGLSSEDESPGIPGGRGGSLPPSSSVSSRAPVGKLSAADPIVDTPSGPKPLSRAKPSLRDTWGR